MGRSLKTFAGFLTSRIWKDTEGKVESGLFEESHRGSQTIVGESAITWIKDAIKITL